MGVMCVAMPNISTLRFTVADSVIHFSVDASTVEFQLLKNDHSGILRLQKMDFLHLVFLSYIKSLVPNGNYSLDRFLR